MCHDHFVANSVVSLAVNEFWKSVNISRGYRHKQCVLFFDSGCSTIWSFQWRSFWKYAN